MFEIFKKKIEHKFLINILEEEIIRIDKFKMKQSILFNHFGINAEFKNFNNQHPTALFLMIFYDRYDMNNIKIFIDEDDNYKFKFSYENKFNKQIKELLYRLYVDKAATYFCKFLQEYDFKNEYNQFLSNPKMYKKKEYLLEMGY